MKKIDVVAAILHRDGAYFATQRGYGEFEAMWEFPGGKIEEGETAEFALMREIQEELGIDITIDKFLCTTEYDYPSFHLTMHCILCTIVSGDLKLLEHEAAKWVNKETLYDIDWLPADKLILPEIEKLLVS